MILISMLWFATPSSQRARICPNAIYLCNSAIKTKQEPLLYPWKPMNSLRCLDMRHARVMRNWLYTSRTLIYARALVGRSRSQHVYYTLPLKLSRVSEPLGSVCLRKGKLKSACVWMRWTFWWRWLWQYSEPTKIGGLQSSLSNTFMLCLADRS